MTMPSYLTRDQQGYSVRFTPINRRRTIPESLVDDRRAALVNSMRRAFLNKQLLKKYYKNLEVRP